MSLEVVEKSFSTTNFAVQQINPIPIINKPTPNSDSIQLSDDAGELKNFPANLSTSSVLEDNNGYSFNFTFDETQYQKATVDGYYSSKEKKLSMNLEFYLEKVLTENGKTKTEKFHIQFSIDYSNIEIKSIEKKIEKENIYDFLNRIMNDINKVLNDDKKNLAGIIFDKEDLMELMQLGDKKAGKFLKEILLLIQTLARIKKQKNPNSENILYNPKRISHNNIETSDIKNSSVDFKLSINKCG